MHYRLIKFIIPSLIVIIWEIVYKYGLVGQSLLPDPINVAKKIIELIYYGTLIPHLWYTLQRTFIGLILAFVLGLSVGMMIYRHRFIKEAFIPLIDFFRSLPAVAVLPLLLIIFGFDEYPKIALVSWACSFVILIGVLGACESMKIGRINRARLKGLKRIKLFIKVVVPEALPGIFIAIRIAISLGLIVDLVAEMFTGGSFGLGIIIYEASIYYRMSELYAYIIITGFVGYLLNKIFILFENRILHWRGR